jgi:hypothetical protein
LRTRKAFLSVGILEDLTGSGSESPSESDDNDNTLLCFRSDLDITSALVCLDALVLRLETLAALEDSHGGEAMCSRTFFHEKDSLFDGLEYDS